MPLGAWPLLDFSASESRSASPAHLSFRRLAKLHNRQRLSFPNGRDELGFRKIEEITPPALGRRQQAERLPAKIKTDDLSNRAPLFEKTRFIVMDRVDIDPIKALRITLIEHALILGQISRAAPAIDHPNHPIVEFGAGSHLVGFDRRMLKLHHQPIGCLDVGNVQLALVVSCWHFLPVLGEMILPGPVPLRFILPPVIAMSLALMGPMPDLLGAASGDKL